MLINNICNSQITLQRVVLCYNDIGKSKEARGMQGVKVKVNTSAKSQCRWFKCQVMNQSLDSQSKRPDGRFKVGRLMVLS